MTREEALENLNLPPDAAEDAIEKAYQRLVRRYPPEFHPDRFRTIDDSYRQLTSLPEMVRKLLSPTVEEAKPNPAVLDFHPSLSDGIVEEALAEVRSAALAATLWKRAEAGRPPRAK